MAKAKATAKVAASKAKKAAPPAKKTITKRAASAPKKAAASKAKAAPAKVTKAAPKKTPVAPKKNAKTRTGQKSLDLCLILDCTASMGSWIQRSKDTLRQIIDKVIADNAGLTVRVSFVAYRDVQDRDRFDVFDFSENIDSIKAAIQKQNATGGGDFPEDVQGGFNKALGLSWGSDCTKLAFHIADAPGHGKDICDWGDNHPKGSPDGFKIQDQMREFAKKDIGFTFVKVNDSCNKMIKVMQENYDPSGNTMNVSDLAEACRTGTQEQVTKAFVNATSFILSAALGGGASGKKGAKALKKVKRTTKPLWDTKKFEEKQYFSQTAYMQVTAIEGNRITVENSYGNPLYVSKDILEGMYSGEHFKKEVPMNMTSLAELLQNVQDHVFQVTFRKQATEEGAADILQGADKNAFKDKAKLSKLAKEVIAGQLCTMTCHLVQVENNLGRSLVIDLTAKGANKFRQIDHRSIESITFQNTKYVLKKGAKAAEEERLGKDEPKWNTANLAVGNWFSGTSYYQAVEDKGDEVVCKSAGKTINISKDILEYEMHNALVFAEEQKISLTNVATVLAEANSKCFTVCFTTKVDEKQVLEKLSAIKAKPNAEKARALAKELLVGEEKVLTGRLSRAEGKLGRSLVVDLPTQGYRQVDHRTLRWLIIDNVKYTVKK